MLNHIKAPLLYFFLSILVSSLCSCKPSVCKIETIKTLHITPGIHDVDTSYGHYVLLKGFSKECMDSLEIVNIAYKYMDTVNAQKPITVIMFYSSGVEFQPGHVPSSPDLEKSCLVKIEFDKRNRKPNYFLFYNNSGENIYWGSRWMKNGVRK